MLSGLGLMRKSYAWIIVMLATGMVVLTGYLLLFANRAPQVDLTIGQNKYTASVFYTDESRKSAYSSTTWPVDEGHVGLFVYENSDKWPVWMPSVSSPRDFIWLTENKTVIDMAQRALPDGEPHREYTSRRDAKYVLVLPGGRAQQTGIKVGQIVQFSLSSIKELSTE